MISLVHQLFRLLSSFSLFLLPWRIHWSHLRQVEHRKRLIRHHCDNWCQLIQFQIQNDLLRPLRSPPLSLASSLFLLRKYQVVRKVHHFSLLSLGHASNCSQLPYSCQWCLGTLRVLLTSKSCSDRFSVTSAQLLSSCWTRILAFSSVSHMEQIWKLNYIRRSLPDRLEPQVPCYMCAVPFCPGIEAWSPPSLLWSCWSHLLKPSI